MPRIYRGRCVRLPSRCFVIITMSLALIFIEALSRVIMDRRAKLTHTALEDTYRLEASISEKISDLNDAERILNMETDGDIKENTIIFVVLVDSYSNDFNIFLSSLSEVTGINDGFIVFSHSTYDETLNNIIKGIDFCRVLQIFYPYSLQTHSREFPGPHPNDCPTDMPTQVAQKVNCTGAYFPDIKGQYRNPSKAERKHHWWWTANQVFERLNCTSKHTGLVIFLEDDFIFTKDFIYMATYMESLAGSVPRCEFLSFGTHSVPDMNYKLSDIHSASLTVWDPSIHSGVLAFNVSIWNIIAGHYDLFCGLDDSSWARSLNYISSNRLDNAKFKVISSVIPRAFKMNVCKGRFICDATYIDRINFFLDETEDLWFPPYMELFIDILYITPDPDEEDPEGGWADPRDKSLCHEMTTSKMKRVIMQMNN